jgi:uncharacterized protein with ParB-like and HNH nuclease domain
MYTRAAGARENFDDKPANENTAGWTFSFQDNFIIKFVLFSRFRAFITKPHKQMKTESFRKCFQLIFQRDLFFIK